LLNHVRSCHTLEVVGIDSGLDWLHWVFLQGIALCLIRIKQLQAKVNVSYETQKTLVEALKTSVESDKLTSRISQNHNKEMTASSVSSVANSEYSSPYPDVDMMVDQLTELADSVEILKTWELMVNQPTVKIHKNPAKDNCFRIEFELESSPETSFDLISDISRRPIWDEMCETGKILQKVNETTNIIYVKMKPIWPVASRDAVLFSHYRRLPDGRLLNVTKSLDSSVYPEEQGIVRMDAGIAGQICSLTSSNTTRVIQIADGDLKGWIPKSVLKFVATTALPNSLAKVNSIVKSLPIQCNSYLLNEEAGEDVIEVFNDEKESVEDRIADLKNHIQSLEENLLQIKQQLVEPYRFLRIFQRFSPILVGILAGLSLINSVKRFRTK
jgi:hypothetical protein